MAEETFFQKLHNFCGNIETDISELQDTLRCRTGIRPQNYRRGMESLRTEVEKVIKLSADVKSNLQKLDNVKHFRCSLRELIGEYKENMWKVEECLQRYGYKAPTDNSFLFNEEKELSEEPQVEIILENPKWNVEDTLFSPDLSEFGKAVIRERNHVTPKVKTNANYIPLSFSTNGINSVHRTRLEEHLRTLPPPLVFEEDILTPFITKSIQTKIDKEVAFDVNAADDIQLSFSPLGQALSTSNILRTNSELQHVIKAVEPNSIKMESSKTLPDQYNLEVPVKVEFRDTPQYSSLNVQTETPESPIMSDVTVKILMEVKEQPPTPESPIIFDITKRVLNINNQKHDKADISVMAETNMNFSLNKKPTPDEDVKSGIAIKSNVISGISRFE